VQGYFKSVRRGRRVFWWGWFVTVLNVHEVHTSTGCPKQVLKVLAAMPTVGEIGSADLCGCGFVKGESVAQIVDEHWLDDGMSKPGRKTRQGLSRNSAAKTLAACTQMRIRQRRNGSLHADANSAACSRLCKSGARLGTILNLDEGLSKAYE
jgi:hypothetical protein